MRELRSKELLMMAPESWTCGTKTFTAIAVKQVTRSAQISQESAGGGDDKMLSPRGTGSRVSGMV